MCCCNSFSDELENALDSNNLECCIQNTPECNCCSCPKPIKRGKFGLAYIVETPRQRYTKPTGWEVEFEGTPSNISYNCKKMTQWVNRPPIAECLEKETQLCCRSIEIRKLLKDDERNPCCCPPQSVVKQPRCICCPEPPICGCSQKLCLCYYTKLPDCQKCNCNRECSCSVDKEDFSCPCSGRKQKRDKCRCEKKDSPDRGDFRCSKSRPKSRRDKRKSRHHSSRTDRDDSLDYIPRKEKVKENWRSEERDRNVVDREKTFIKEKGDSKKSTYTLTDNFNSQAKENRNNTTVSSPKDDLPLGTIRENTFVNNTQKDNTFSFRENEFLSSTPNNSPKASRDTTVKNEPTSTVAEESIIFEPIPLPWKTSTQIDETTTEKKFNHRKDPTPLLQKIRRAHQKQIDDIESAREAEVHNVTFP